MIIDVICINKDTTKTLDSYPGITMFKNLYCHWFNNSNSIYIRQVGKKHKGSWRLLPNRSTEFWRCHKVTSETVINQLNFLFDAIGV